MDPHAVEGINHPALCVPIMSRNGVEVGGLASEGVGLLDVQRVDLDDQADQIVQVRRRVGGDLELLQVGDPLAPDLRLCLRGPIWCFAVSACQASELAADAASNWAAATLRTVSGSGWVSAGARRTRTAPGHRRWAEPGCRLRVPRRRPGPPGCPRATTAGWVSSCRRPPAGTRRRARSPPASRTRASCTPWLDRLRADGLIRSVVQRIQPEQRQHRCRDARSGQATGSCSV